MSNENRFTYNMFYMEGKFDGELKLYEINNNMSDYLNLFYVYSDSEEEIKSLVDKLNAFVEENEKLKKALLFFIDVANVECSSNWVEDMEKDCQKLFNCSYEEAEEKYGGYDEDIL